MGYNPKCLDNLKPAQKGEVRNPKGRLPDPPEVKMIKKMSKKILNAKIDEYLDKTVEELQSILDDKTAKTLDHFIGRIVMQGIVKGDPTRFDTLINRRIGKVKDRIEVARPKPTIIKRPNGEEIELGSELKEEIKDTSIDDDEDYDD